MALTTPRGFIQVAAYVRPELRRRMEVLKGRDRRVSFSQIIEAALVKYFDQLDQERHPQSHKPKSH